MNFRLQKLPGQPALGFLEGPQEGQPLLFLHGVGRYSADYNTLASALGSGFHIQALDFRGHGDSGRVPGKYLVRDYVEDALSFVRQRCPAPVLIYGHSLGAMVALAVAAAEPSRVRGLILEDPPFHTMGRRIKETAWHAVFVGMREIMRRELSVDSMASALGEIVLPSAQGGGIKLGTLRSPAALRFSALCLAKVDPDVFACVIEGRWLDGYCAESFYPKIQCPVWLLQGDPSAGGALSDDDAEQAVDGLSTCRRIRFEGTGHLIHGDRLDEVARLVGEFAVMLDKFTVSAREEGG